VINLDKAKTISGWMAHVQRDERREGEKNRNPLPNRREWQKKQTRRKKNPFRVGRGRQRSGHGNLGQNQVSEKRMSKSFNSEQTRDTRTLGGLERGLDIHINPISPCN